MERKAAAEIKVILSNFSNFLALKLFQPDWLLGKVRQKESRKSKKEILCAEWKYFDLLCYPS